VTVQEPLATASLLLVAGILIAASVLFSRTSARFGVPVFLLFLGFGMLAGSEGVLGIPFEDYRLAFQLGTLALVLILFDGGLNTPLAAIRGSLGPAVTLATAGVAVTAAVVAGAARLFGLPWPAALLLGAVVSSTDAAAVFAVLRASGLRLRRRVGATLELESGLNDPMAVLLTVVCTELALAPEGIGWATVVELPVQLAVGAAFGIVVGRAARALLARWRLPISGLYPVLTFGIALIAFGLPTLLHGSGFLAVYLAGAVLGDGRLPYRPGLLRFHDAAAWAGQVLMFLMLGLLCFPSRLWDAAGVGIALSLVLTLAARPLAVALSLLPFRYPLREVGFVAAVGLRGAVPIILATFPVMQGVAGAERLFDVVFFVVVFTALIPGGMVPWITRRLGLVSDAPPPPPAVLEITTTQPLSGEVHGTTLHPAAAACGATIADLPFPAGATVLLVVRGTELIAPRGNTLLTPGDHVFVFCKPENLPLVRLLLGMEEE
jgi:cell volume regulation protein A